MTKIEAIKERKNAATEGPWEGGYYPNRRKPNLYITANGELLDNLAANLTFIAHSRQDMSYLVDLLEKMLPIVEKHAKRSCTAWMDKGSLMDNDCGRCHPCQARAILKEISREQPHER